MFYTQQTQSLPRSQYTQRFDVCFPDVCRKCSSQDEYQCTQGQD